jgi:CheY-like chemotaxis protein
LALDFSTNNDDGGLGLATVYSIITRHNGRIEVDTLIGKGTRFTTYMTVKNSQDRVDEMSKKEAKEASGSATVARILVMDDEEMICDLATTMLESKGNVVSSASGGEQAIGLYKQSLDEGKPFDCIIMDLTIPGGIGGKEAIDEILKLNPHAKVIVSSGYSADPVMANFTDYGFKGALPKPFTFQGMYEEVSRVLKSK